MLKPNTPPPGTPLPAKTRRRRLKRWIAFGALVAALAYLVVGDYGFYKIGRLFFKQQELKRTLAAEKAKKDSLAVLKYRARTDTTLLEKVAREKLGMARQNETVYKFMDKDTSSAR